MNEISLYNFKCLNNQPSLQWLNKLIEQPSNFFTHEIAHATGCEYSEAIAIALLLLNRGLADLFIVVYHNDHLNELVPAAIRSIWDGFPPLPFECSLCEKEITDINELSYDFMFRIKKNIEIRFTE